ncbi:hypothetical protein A3D05_01915 [Candidatus Gottesmanbacteria bacterium RIFCSPHIGHO2_02_FULL_40_24]|uniref:Transcriptional regulator n=1 Tax=Candidatus Gottesmanbacteria bacterium RIFCSPHIGHO2_01_FULL_40_15 TaxID=1798376 RepID=A0A1F5Z3X1_9BACT|nr:MAG: hypothetical protein A2777_04320 [Candidatus Gottesmanbacteria bacterium RIFCSPHIGHO2_01_FULL_40_15]OGG18612.1 MAG: hypothetical protein A3D05_01915 [Candidatus Gottesmanbacteria bacterium RIFCSPHIGHO2_02_FULL_40_24]OGG22839.1 MAG: hypothetical protein A3B48_05635 [Candidatus Gottesmanbacteria bacterium RIFCSPLOWO2_01_FULL_40_10]OGG24926.1 MAG: hypothetical protein A3E42_02735 [Candidatus Gottesmanbacteria bacterium RIFCSPHIGHO2_12_FULL_40_13]OGG31731.1 MAG: hypothetical protein A3I80_0
MDDKTAKINIIKRLKIAGGHLNKVTRMVENDAYCIDTLHQTRAVQAALKEIDNLILNNHLNTCVVNSIKKGKSKEVINEIMYVFKRSRK